MVQSVYVMSLLVCLCVDKNNGYSLWTDSRRLRNDKPLQFQREASLYMQYADEEDEDTKILGTSSDKLPSNAFGADSVPTGQRPANEYLNLISSPLFDWANEQRGDMGLASRLGFTYLIFYFLVCFPISSATFTQEGYLLHKIFASNVGALGVVFILLIRLYAGWGYVGSRLTSTVIEYEKTGWYEEGP
jgi:hypothetical protein